MDPHDEPLARSLTVTMLPDQHDRPHRDGPLTRVRLGPDDLSELADFLVVCDTAVVGHADISEEELVADLRNPEVESYGWRDDTGRLVAHGYAERIADSDKVILDAYVLPDVEDQSLGLAVLQFLEERGRAVVAAGGKDSVVFDTGTYRQDEKTRGWLTSSGYESPTAFVRMRIDFPASGEPVQQPATPGMTVRRSELTDDDLRAAHRIDEQSFVEHYGHVPVDYDNWLTHLTEHGEDFTQLWLSEVDGEPVGLLVGNRRFEKEQDAGYVRTLGTLPAARGRGVGKALLRAYFGSEQRAGRAAVLLHVDVANVTGALAIYESVGMRPVETIDAWTKRSAVSA